MGTIKDIIEHSNTHIVAEQNRLVVTEMLSKSNLDQIEQETWQEKSLGGFNVPKSLRTDTFKDGVVKNARELQELWPAYLNQGRTATTSTSKSKAKQKKDSPVDHKEIRGKFLVLGVKAKEWLESNSDGNEAKRKHGEQLREMAKIGLREVERAMLHEASAWLLEQTPPKTEKDRHPAPLNPELQAQDPETVLRFAEEFGLKTEDAKRQLESVVKMLQREAAAILPQGYERFKRDVIPNINTRVPEEARPKLSLDEAMALQNYCIEHCYPINEALRGDAIAKLQFDRPATKEQLALLTNQMIADEKKKREAKLAKEREILEGRKIEFANRQAACLADTNNVTSKHQRRFSAQELAGFTSEQFQAQLEQLGVPTKLRAELTQAHDIAYRMSRENVANNEARFQEQEDSIRNIEQSDCAAKCAEFAQEFAHLQQAFAKAKPFPTPVNVRRGLRFSDQQTAEKYVERLQGLYERKELFPLEGFQSTSTNSIPSTGRPSTTNNEYYFVKIALVAKQGLDVMPYAGLQNERELLLCHGTLVRVTRDIVMKVKDGITTWSVTLEQVLPQNQT